MSLLSQNKPSIEIKLYYKEVKLESGFTKIMVLKDEEGEKLLQEQEARDAKNAEIKKKKEAEKKNTAKKPQEVEKAELRAESKEESKVEEIEEVNFRVCLLKTQWRILSWKQQTDITRESAYFNRQEAFQDLDIWKFRDLRIKACMVSWDLKDDNNQPIPAKPDVIDQLPADVVLSLVSKYDVAVSLNEDESKNS